MPKIYDNIDLSFESGLLEHLKAADRVDYCAGYFNLRGWRSVCGHIDTLKGMDVDENGAARRRYCRLLIGMLKSPKELLRNEFENADGLLMDNDGANKRRKELALELADQLTVGTPSQQDEAVLRKLLEQLKSERVAVKLFLAHQLHAKLYLAHCPGNITPRLGLLGSSNFTFSGLCAQGELNIDVIEQDTAAKLDRWFNDRWNDRWCIDITRDLIAVLENSWARVDLIPPYHIYLKMAYHISREARAGLAEYSLSREFARELLEFQQTAVKIAARCLHKRHGVIIGDVVGLGKTITAAAIAKIMEDDLYYNTLITCPKNLVSMWEGYREKYGLHAKVISHSVLQRDLPGLKRYKLVIVDESHNFRNSSAERYRALKEYIEENECKVILLSATPYNKSYADLSNQLRLFLPSDCDLCIKPEQYINELGGMAKFAEKHPDTDAKTIGAFEKSDYPDDWREIMKMYLVRRTRSFIKKHYAKDDAAAGRKYLVFANGERSYFPVRKPKRAGFKLSAKDPADQYAALYDEETVAAINKLALPRYGLQQYRNAGSGHEPTVQEQLILSNLSRAGKRVIGFCRTNLYKRLESSGYSFMLSVSRHILRNYIFLYALNNGLKLPVSGKSAAAGIDMYTDTDNEDENEGEGPRLDFGWTQAEYEKAAKKYYAAFENDCKERFQWIRGEVLDAEKLSKDLKADADSLMSILGKIKNWRPETDRKLKKLVNLLTVAHKSEKVLVFTQYADTAEYLYSELKKAGVSDAALVVGDSDNIVESVARFSPVSNGDLSPSLKTGGELRVLIATDVLSEGQNLQDAHIIVNFDLPWAIVRLIQRAGRVDRLGQKAAEIQCYSFLPEDGIEKIIGLRGKLKTRIKENAEVVGSDEVFFDGDPVNISDLYNEKAGIFDEEEDGDVDLTSYAYQIWKDATDGKPELKTAIEALPNVVFSAKQNDAAKGSDGVIVYARTADGNDALAKIDNNGEIATQSQYAILRAAECAADTPAIEKAANHHSLVKSGVRQIAAEASSASGTLGRKNGAKYRAYMRLERYVNENAETLLCSNPEKVKKALDEIYRFPLKESAADTLSRQMKAGIADFDLQNLILTLYDDRKLCNADEAAPADSPPQIICSLGLIGGAK
ncbi:MAG: phospholipase D-like domain-containing protein [Chitinispirillales bacterium]|jgi:superfamily II DNA or RNA helicase|nr:phospholipase D-like domain-containing protein [Chitinispirillales bacterium]